jgi:septal ring factor EnvC (AmiA/AmiB activator)
VDEFDEENFVKSEQFSVKACALKVMEACIFLQAVVWKMSGQKDAALKQSQIDAEEKRQRVQQVQFQLQQLEARKREQDLEEVRNKLHQLGSKSKKECNSYENPYYVTQKGCRSVCVNGDWNQVCEAP